MPLWRCEFQIYQWVIFSKWFDDFVLVKIWCISDIVRVLQQHETLMESLWLPHTTQNFLEQLIICGEETSAPQYLRSLLQAIYIAKVVWFFSLCRYSNGLVPTKVLDTLPLNILKKTGGLPCEVGEPFAFRYSSWDSVKLYYERKIYLTKDFITLSHKFLDSLIIL